MTERLGALGLLERPLWGWLGVGLLVRLLLAPFAVSADLLAVYWRSHAIAYDGTLFADYLVNMGAHYAHAAWLRLAAPLLPSPDVLWTDPWWWSDSSALAGQVQRAFVEVPGVYQTLLVLKLPYLLADLGAGLVLLGLLRGAEQRARRRAFAFWMLSPIGLYAGYVFGRYEMFAVVGVVGALLLVERDRPWWGAAVLGVAVTMRGYPLLLVPVMALVAVREWPRQLAWAGLACLPFGLTMAANRLLAGSVGELARLQDFSTGSTFLAYTLPVDGDGQVYVFVLAWLLLVGALLGRQRGWWGAPVLVADLWVWLLVLHVAMFGLATFSAHYLAWLTPFVALAIGRRAHWRGVLPLHLATVAVVLLIADVLGGPSTTTALFQPVAPDLASSLPNLREVLLTRPDAADRLLGLLRTAFLAGSALLVWPALRAIAAPAAQAPDRQSQRTQDGRRPADREGTGVVDPGEAATQQVAQGGRTG